MRLVISIILSAASCLILSSCTSVQPAQQVNMDAFVQQKLPDDLLPAKSVPEVQLGVLASGSEEALERQMLLARKTGLNPTVKTKACGIILSLIPPGTFQMGSSKWEKDRDNDEDLHSVTISRPFYMGKFEITQEEWTKVMGSNPSKFQTKSGTSPVEMVSWNDCVEFCKKLCIMEKVPEGTYRLPTEAEWEYACRAGTETAFCYGKKLSSDMAHFDQMPYVGNTSTLSVGRFLPNAWGLHDMHGNVYEWCEDWFGSYSGANSVDPKGPRGGVQKVSRGGGWGIQASYCRSANRCADAKPGHKMFALGFRIVRELQR